MGWGKKIEEVFEMKGKLGLQDFLLRGTGKQIFLGIDNDQYCFKDLCHKVTDIRSPGTLYKYLKQMMNLGLIEIIERKGGPRLGKKKRVYQLTEEGKKIVEQIKNILLEEQTICLAEKNICLATQKIEEIIKTLSNEE